MVITQYGMGYIKAQLGDYIVAFNPISKDFDAKAAKFGADLALVSLNDSAFNGVDNVTYGTKIPFTIEGPGEYEIGGMFVRGFASKGPGEMINTIYTITIDGIKICNLGALASPDIDAEALEAIGTIDLLFLPVGEGCLSVKDASKLAANLEPKMVVPTCYSADSLKQFLKEEAVEGGKPVEKLAIKRKDLDGKEGEIVVIQS